MHENDYETETTGRSNDAWGKNADPQGRDHDARGREATPPTLPKIVGYDGEVGNFISGPDISGGTGREASRAIIREIEGTTRRGGRFFLNCPCPECERFRQKLLRGIGSQPYRAVDGGFIDPNSVWKQIAAKKAGEDPRDHDRRYLAGNGGCIYIDLDHVELCLPETRSAFDHVACWHAGLRILRRALDAANRRMPDGQKVHVLINNSDGKGNSYGTHMNYLVTRRCWRNIFERKMQYLLYLAAYQVSSIVFTGQGKVGSENRQADVDFQLSQRADFFEQIVGSQTTYSRPIVNSRDEPLCGTSDYRRQVFVDDGRGGWWTDPYEGDKARLHVIFYDSTLCHVSTLLKSGVMQIILAMIEAENVNRRLILDDPLGALRTWSHDPGLTSTARLFSGRAVTAVELQHHFLEEATRFVSRGGCEGIVTGADEILDLWADTLTRLKNRDMDTLSRRLDWALKWSVLDGVMAEHRDLDWKHPSIKRLDHVYSSLDLDEGLYWAYENDGHVERVVGEDAVAHFESNPPEDTRAWTRAMLLRTLGPDKVEDVDWDSIRFVEGHDDLSFRHRTVDLPDPLGHGRDVWNDGPETSDTDGSIDAVLSALDRSA